MTQCGYTAGIWWWILTSVRGAVINPSETGQFQFMFLRLSATLALCVSITQLAISANASAADGDSPETAIAEFYRLMSFEAGSRPDYDRIRSLLADDAVLLMSASPESIELIDADESIRRIRQKTEESGLGDYGFLATPRNINCRVANATAHCVTVVEVQYPGLDVQPVVSTDLTTLEKQEGRWLATSSAMFVSVPDVEPPSILSFPVKRSGPTPTEGRKWDRPLPFLAQKVMDLGYDLPEPFGISIIPVMMRQDMDLDNLAISLTGGPLRDIDIVNFAGTSVDSTTLQIKLDAWLFPFMNAFASVGYVDGGASVPVAVLGTDFMDFLGLGARCDGGVLEPDMCQRTLVGDFDTSYRGESYTAGFTLATGWKNMFVAIPVSYTVTHLDDGKKPEAFNVSPRVGVNSDTGGWGVISTYIGATYLDSENVVTGEFTFDTSDSGVPELGDTTTIDYQVDQSSKDKWNYLIGFNWNVSKKWSAMAEAGFGGSRSNFISSFTYRF
jgi:hypothetical protein